MTISKKPVGRETGNPSPPRLQLQNTLESSLWYANLEEGWRYVMDQRHNGFEHLSSHSTRPLPFSRWLFPSIRCLYFDGYPYAPGSVYCTGTQESAAVLWTQFCNCNNHANNISLGLLIFVCCLSLYALVVRAHRPLLFCLYTWFVPFLETSIWIWGQTGNSLIKAVHQAGSNF